MQKGHHGRCAALDQAILILAEAIAKRQDDRTGRFVVEATDNRPEFRIFTKDDSGGGIHACRMRPRTAPCSGFALVRRGAPGDLSDAMVRPMGAQARTDHAQPLWCRARNDGGSF